MTCGASLCLYCFYNMSEIGAAWRHCWSYLVLLHWISMNVICVIVILGILWMFILDTQLLVSHTSRHLCNQILYAQVARELQYTFHHGWEFLFIKFKLYILLFSKILSIYGKMARKWIFWEYAHQILILGLNTYINFWTI